MIYLVTTQEKLKNLDFTIISAEEALNMMES